MARLTNLDVEYVSLVDRAAVRDPIEHTEPHRFLLTKREEQEKDMSEQTDPAQERREAATAALEMLENLEAEVDPTLIAKLKSLAGLEQGETAKSEDPRARVAKSMEEMERLEKSVKDISGAEGVRLRQRVRKAREQVQFEYLAAMSPAAARHYEMRKAQAGHEIG